MPSPQELMVSIEQLNGETVISPQAQEVCQFARVNRPVPKLVVSGLRAQNQVRLVEEPKSGVSGQASGGSTARESKGRSPKRGEPVALNNVPAATARPADAKRTAGDVETPQRFRPLSDDWRTVQWDGMTINLREREKVKDFLRMLWNKGAKRRTGAVAAGARFAKPSSLFVAGERYIREPASSNGRDVAVPSESGSMIRLVYREAVGKVVAGRRGVGPTKYYLRVFADSDNT
jgi:hypothetical protein